MSRKAIAINLAGFAVFCFLAYKAYALFFLPDYAWNQKLTLVVDTPDGVKTGSAVTRVEWKRNHFFKDGGPWWTSVYGEAAYVDLGGGRYLFATLGRSASLAMTVLQAGSARTWSISDGYQKFRDLKVPLLLTETNRPRIILFTSIIDPASVMEVTADNVRVTLGNEVSISKISLEMTKEVVSENTLPKGMTWLSEYYGKRLDGERFGNFNAENKVANSLSSGAFKVESNK